MGDVQDIGTAGLGANLVWMCGKKAKSRVSPHSLIWGTSWWEEPSVGSQNRRRGWSVGETMNFLSDV